MVEDSGRCEVASCGMNLVGESFFDRYFKKRMCSSCFKETFRQSELSGFGEWFEKNYNFTDYPKEFWNKVGAFVDLRQASMGDPYK